jgi:hypothetical protein
VISSSGRRRTRSHRGGAGSWEGGEAIDLGAARSTAGARVDGGALEKTLLFFHFDISDFDFNRADMWGHQQIDF